MIFILEVVKVVFEMLSQRKYCGLPICKCGSAKRKNKTTRQKFELKLEEGFYFFIVYDLARSSLNLFDGTNSLKNKKNVL